VPLLLATRDNVDGARDIFILSKLRVVGLEVMIGERGLDVMTFMLLDWIRRRGCVDSEC
jgi:hypothetical protein